MLKTNTCIPKWLDLINIYIKGLSYYHCHCHCHCHKWITGCLIPSIKYRDNLYKKLKLNNPKSLEPHDTILTSVLSSFKYNSSADGNINNEFDTINEWLKVNKLSLNIKKNINIWFSIHHKRG